MSLQTRTQVDTTITTDIADNTSGDISAGDVRGALTDIADSALFLGDAEIRVIDMDSTSPPVSPSDRDAYVVAASATGDWAGQDDDIAIYDTGEAAWFFVTPVDGTAVWNKDDDTPYRWDGSSWVAKQATAIAKATAANIRAGTADKYITADGIESAAEEVTLTDAATIAVDWSSFINAKVTIGGNRTLGAPTNGEPGTSRFIRVIQDATGSRTLAFNSAYKHPGGTAPTLTTTAGAVDVLEIYCVDTSTFYVFSALDMR